MSQPEQPIVSIRHVSKSFGAVQALNDVSIDIQSGEIFALLGPSGCGKSTLLRVISGFETPTSGELLLDGTDMTRLPPNKRPVNMVFQSYAVFPHMSVAENVGYGLKMEGLAQADIKQRVVEALEQVHLAGYGKRRPDQLSGGQRQRVALARALIKRPRVLLLDEPLSALDAKLRDAMRLELVKLQETVGITFVIVTHDQAEAMAMADRIAVLENGSLRQVAPPAELYRSPVDTFVADFIGNIHTFAGMVAGSPVNDSQGDYLIDSEAFGEVHVPAAACLDINRTRLPTGARCQIAIRPEHIKVRLEQGDTNSDTPSATKPQDVLSVAGTLGDIAFQGQHSIIEVTRGDRPSLTSVMNTDDADVLAAAENQAKVVAYWETHRVLLLPDEACNS